MQMKTKNAWVAACLLCLSTATCYPANKTENGVDFIPSGKWERNNGYAHCVPKDNRAPDPQRLAAEVAASSSTGDYRWVGECRLLKYSAKMHSFSAKLSCSQRSERTGIKTSWIYYISGVLSDSSEYRITEQVPKRYSNTTIYRRVSNTCMLNPRETIIGPKTSIAQPLNPLLDSLAGWPEGTEINMP